MSGVTPPGFETFREGRRRAWDEWQRDGTSKLLGLLVTGRLTAWRANKDGTVEQIPIEFWQTGDGVRLCNCRPQEIGNLSNPPVFSKKDLEREIPSQLEALAQRTAERRSREASSKELQSEHSSLPSAEKTQKPKASKAALEAWFADIRVRGWSADKKPPTEKDDWEAAKDYFDPEYLTRDSFREVRRRRVPENWRKQGRRLPSQYQNSKMS